MKMFKMMAAPCWVWRCAWDSLLAVTMTKMRMVRVAKTPPLWSILRKCLRGGLPKSVSGMAISHNEEGLVTNITTEDGDKAVFEYFPATTKADVAKDRARITVTDEEGDVTELNLQLNSDGYVEFCNSIDHAGTPDADEFTWEMEYDTEGHLVVMKRSESDGEITNITYKDGDVVKTSTRYVASGDLNGDGIIDSNDEWEYSAAIDYTTDNITAPIENKGCLMLFDEILDVDMDEMIYAYYGACLVRLRNICRL